MTRTSKTKSRLMNSTTMTPTQMKTTSENAFQPSRPVTGAEALEAIGALESLAGSR